MIDRFGVDNPQPMNFVAYEDNNAAERAVKKIEKDCEYQALMKQLEPLVASAPRRN